MPDRQLRVLARNRRTNNVLRVYRTTSGFTRDPHHKHLVRGAEGLFTRGEARDAIRWADRHDLAGYATGSRYPFLVLDSDTRMVRPDLAHALNTLSQRLMRYGWIGEGWRTRARQQALWDAYVARGYAPPLVARPGTSNHESGNAADFSILRSGRGGSYVNVGHWPGARDVMHRLDACLPVPGEAWHVELGSSWRA